MGEIDGLRERVEVVRREYAALPTDGWGQPGPLDEGTLEGDVVTCPWHGSKFCVLDGGIVAGPAAYPQPAFRARVLDGRVRIAADDRMRR